MLMPYQKERIKLMKEILPLFGDKYVLKGGTALLLYYGLDRYSEDLDFDCLTNNMDFTKRLIKHKDFKNWNISIKKNTDTVFRAMIDYGANSSLGEYPLKIEVSSRNSNFLKNKKLEYKTIDGVNVYDIKELIKMKANAFTNRDKIRDLYDISFLLEKYPDCFTSETLFNIHDKLSYSDKNDLELLLMDEFKNHKLTNNYNNFYGFIDRIEENINNINKNIELKFSKNGNLIVGKEIISKLQNNKIDITRNYE